MQSMQQHERDTDIEQEAANCRADRFAVCCTHRAEQLLAFYTVLNCGDERDSAYACFETADHRHEPSLMHAPADSTIEMDSLHGCVHHFCNLHTA